MTNIADTHLNGYEIVADVAVLRSRALRRCEVNNALEAWLASAVGALHGDRRQRLGGVAPAQLLVRALVDEVRVLSITRGLHPQPAFDERDKHLGLPVAETLAARILTPPLHRGLTAGRDAQVVDGARS